MRPVDPASLADKSGQPRWHVSLWALRDALNDAGAEPETAGKAAEQLAAYHDQIDALRHIISEHRPGSTYGSLVFVQPPIEYAGRTCAPEIAVLVRETK